MRLRLPRRWILCAPIYLFCLLLYLSLRTWCGFRCGEVFSRGLTRHASFNQ